MPERERECAKVSLRERLKVTQSVRHPRLCREIDERRFPMPRAHTRASRRAPRARKRRATTSRLNRSGGLKSEHRGEGTRRAPHALAGRIRGEGRGREGREHTHSVRGSFARKISHLTRESTIQICALIVSIHIHGSTPRLYSRSNSESGSRSRVLPLLQERTPKTRALNYVITRGVLSCRRRRERN